MDPHSPLPREDFQSHDDAWGAIKVSILGGVALIIALIVIYIISSPEIYS